MVGRGNSFNSLPHYKYKYSSLIKIYSGSNTWNPQPDRNKEQWTPHFLKNLNLQPELIQLPTNSAAQQSFLIFVRDPLPTLNTFCHSVKSSKHSRICGKKHTNKSKVNCLNLVDTESKICKLKTNIHTPINFFFCSKKAITKKNQKSLAKFLGSLTSSNQYKSLILPHFLQNIYLCLIKSRMGKFKKYRNVFAIKNQKNTQDNISLFSNIAAIKICYSCVFQVSWKIHIELVNMYKYSFFLYIYANILQLRVDSVC